MTDAENEADRKNMNCHRRMISLPPEMAKQMAYFSGVNWSGVAQEAFRMKLHEIGADVIDTTEKPSDPRRDYFIAVALRGLSSREKVGEALEVAIKACSIADHVLKITGEK